MAKTTKKPRPWSIEDVRLLKTLVKEKTKTSVVARKLKRTEGATRQKASEVCDDCTEPDITANAVIEMAKEALADVRRKVEETIGRAIEAARDQAEQAPHPAVDVDPEPA
jgi:hypothetical protein